MHDPGRLPANTSKTIFIRKNNAHQKLLPVLATLLTLVSLAAQADQLADIKKKGQIVIGVLGTDEPNSFVDPKTRELIAYDLDLATAVAKKISAKPVFKQIAVAARIPELQQGHVDLLAASLTHNKEREAQIDFSLTTFVTGQKVLVKKSSNITDVPQNGRYGDYLLAKVSKVFPELVREEL